MMYVQLLGLGQTIEHINNVIDAIATLAIILELS